MSCSQSPCPVLTAIYLLLPVLKAQGIQVNPKVWGYVGQKEVILPCQFVPGPKNGSVTQVQWDLTVTDPKEGDKTLIVHVVGEESKYIKDEYSGKLDLKKYSLVIKNVEAEDAGVYTCALATFPNGPFVDKTTLCISDQMPLSAGAVSAIVISVLLLLGIIAASVYFIVIRRCPPSSRNHITIDTAEWDPSRASFIKTDDVVYADVTVRQPSNQKRVNSSKDHVTYSEVRVSRTRPDETLYDLVMNI